MAALMIGSLIGCDRGGFTLTDAPPRQTLSGVLVGGSSNGTDCAWIEASSGIRTEIFWPDGWRTEFKPLAIFDQNGAQVIHGGEGVTLSGFVAEAGASLCSTGALFNAETVISVDDAG